MSPGVQKTHTITVLHVLGCAGGAAALAAASRVAAGRSDVRLEDVVVGTPEEAAALGFRGSPTVLVDGRDLEPDTEVPPGSMG